jgi:multidrug efflux pump
MGAFMGIKDAMAFALTPPSIPSLGTATGFNFYLQDMGNVGRNGLMQAMGAFMGAAAKNPVLTGVRPNTALDETQYKLTVDEDRARVLGLELSQVYSNLAIAFGGNYVNDFLENGKVKKVYIQGDTSTRMTPEDVGKWYARNNQGEMIPYSSFTKGDWIYGAPKLTRYNSILAIEFQGAAAPGFSSGEAMAEVEKIVAGLPNGVGMSWTGLSYEEVESGNTVYILYALSVLVVILCLAALYESWSIPFAVILTVPLGVLGVFLATWYFKMSNDIFFKIGLLTTIGLSARNAILIVEFARDLHHEGMTLFDSALEACRMRLRPIVMTSFAFILGVLPLAMATGVSAASKKSIGIGVIGGMISALLLAIFWIPLFYFIFSSLSDRFSSKNKEIV